MCPNEVVNRRRYDVDAEDLTGLGMQEEYKFGQYLRTQYRAFLGDRFNRSLHFFRAVGEPRILQSAMAVAQGVFPDGFGPGGFLPGRPQFVPIFSDMDTHEYLLDDVPCFRRAEVDSHRWVKENLTDFMKDPEHMAALQTMRRVCGAPNGNFSEFAYIKTVADGMTFNYDYGMRIGRGRDMLTAEDLFRVRRLSLALLMQRLYYTDEQQTYTVVDLPISILRIFNHTHVGEGPVQLNDFHDTRQESSFYFVHRESLYALAQFFGWRYEVPGMPTGEVPVAASLIIEKLMPEHEQYLHNATTAYIRFTLYTPYNGIHTLGVPSCRVPELCEMSELRAIYDTRVERTGTWEKLCDYVPQEIDHTTDIR
ncbi:acid phosphatase [Strigomonas culicis]|nr:acid phosphatase [Strigomonas culicis]|eukprot:EPY32941.1 acid phosphatase [Strigomonas culicis]